MNTNKRQPAQSGSLHPICSAFLRGYCILAFTFLHALHFPLFAIFWIGRIAELVMENVTCRAGQHIVKVWRYSGSPNAEARDSRDKSQPTN